MSTRCLGAIGVGAVVSLAIPVGTAVVSGGLDTRVEMFSRQFYAFDDRLNCRALIMSGPLVTSSWFYWGAGNANFDWWERLDKRRHRSIRSYETPSAVGIPMIPRAAPIMVLAYGFPLRCLERLSQ